MKNIVLVLIVLSLSLTGCSSTRVVNGKEQTFTDFVILNKENRAKREIDSSMDDWNNMNSDCFPFLRLRKWYNAK